jgi:hypothetical protein
MVGDTLFDEESSITTYQDYFVSNCYPKTPDIILQVVEKKTEFYLQQSGLGSPILPPHTVSHTLKEIVSNQGYVFKETLEECLKNIESNVKKMVVRTASSKKVLSGDPLLSIEHDDHGAFDVIISRRLTGRNTRKIFIDDSV